MNAMAFDVASVEELVRSPLAKFITFSENDCVYSGCKKGIIVTFLPKTEGFAVKADNPNWW